MSLQVDSAVQSGIPGLVVAGDLDIHTAKNLQRNLQSLIEQGHSTLGLDLAEVRYLDSSGVSVLLAAFNRLRSEMRNLVIWNYSYAVSRVFRVLGLAHLLGMEHTPPR